MFRIKLLIEFEKTYVWAVFALFQDANNENMYSKATNSLERNVFVPPKSSMPQKFHGYPKQFDQTIHVNVAGSFIGDTGREEAATLAYLTRRKDGNPPRSG